MRSLHVRLLELRTPCEFLRGCFLSFILLGGILRPHVEWCSTGVGGDSADWQPKSARWRHGHLLDVSAVWGMTGEPAAGARCTAINVSATASRWSVTTLTSVNSTTESACWVYISGLVRWFFALTTRHARNDGEEWRSLKNQHNREVCWCSAVLSSLLSQSINFTGISQFTEWYKTIRSEFKEWKCDNSKHSKVFLR